MLTLPAIEESNTRATITAGDETFTLVFRWNARDAAWYFDALDGDQRPIATGIRIVLGAYLGRRIRHPLFRDGLFVAVDTTRQGVEAGEHDLGTRVALRYYDAVEAGLLRAGAEVVIEGAS